MVRVVSRTRQKWVIELADHTRLSVPLAWAVPVEDGPLAPLGAPVPSLEPSPVDVTALLDLAIMVQRITTQRAQEVNGHALTTHTGSPTGDERSPVSGSEFATSLGAVAPGTQARADYDTDHHPGQAPARPTQRAGADEP